MTEARSRYVDPHLNQIMIGVIKTPNINEIPQKIKTITKLEKRYRPVMMRYEAGNYIACFSNGNRIFKEEVIQPKIKKTI